MIVFAIRDKIKIEKKKKEKNICTKYARLPGYQSI